MNLFLWNGITRACFTELPIDQGAGITMEYQGIRILIDKSLDPATLRRLELYCGTNVPRRTTVRSIFYFFELPERSHESALLGR